MMAKKFSGLLVVPGARVDGAVLCGRGVSIWYHAKVTGVEGEVMIGDDTNVQDHAKVTGPIQIGCGCTIGHGAQLRRCTIGDNTLVGIGAQVLDGVQVGSNCVIGAGACLFPGLEVPDGSMVLGNPAKVVRPVTEAEIEGNREYVRKYDHNIQAYLNGNVSKAD